MPNENSERRRNPAQNSSWRRGIAYLLIPLAAMILLFPDYKKHATDLNRLKFEPQWLEEGPPQTLSHARVPAGMVNWIESFEAFIAQPLPTPTEAPHELPDSPFRLLYFRTPHEFGCQQLESQTFGDPSLAQYLNASAVAHYVEWSQVPELARRYDVEDVPTLTILDAEGGFIGSILGYRPPERLPKDLKPLLLQIAVLQERKSTLLEKLKTASGMERAQTLDALAQLALERRLYAEVTQHLTELAGMSEAESVRSATSLWSMLARAQHALGQIEAALTAYRKAIEKDALGVYAEQLSFEQAGMLTQAGQMQEALERWQIFLKEHAQSELYNHAAYNAVYTLLALERREEAANEIKKLLKRPLPPQAANALRTLLYATAGSDAVVKQALALETERVRIQDALEEGRVLVTKYSCHDCHYFIEPDFKSKHLSCVECHLIVKGLEASPQKHDEVLARHPHFFRNCSRIRHGYRAPYLFGLGAMVRGAWIAEYLKHPHDLRPYLEESMLKIPFAPHEVETLVRYFEAMAKVSGYTPPELETEDQEVPNGEQIARGRDLFVARNCANCHQLGNLQFGPQQGQWAWSEGRAEAPNLRFTRERMTKASARLWLQDPAHIRPGTRMPKPELTASEIEAVITFIFHAEPGAPYRETKPVPLFELDYEPTWEEVSAAVFQDTCIHCHMREDEGGAGVVGAYGFRARRLDLSSYAGIKRGSLQPDGTRLDILTAPGEGELPPILDRVLLRRLENGYDFILPNQDPLNGELPAVLSADKPGMPLGHPALKPEQIALLRAWLKAGAPGPRSKPLGEPKSDTGGSMPISGSLGP